MAPFTFLGTLPGRSQGRAAGGVVPSFSTQERSVGGTMVPSGFSASLGSRSKAVEL